MPEFKPDFGPFMAIYYTAVRHWHPGQIGILIACQSLAGIAVHSFSGNYVDESHHKKLLTGIAGNCNARRPGDCHAPQILDEIGVQLVIGVAVTVFPANAGPHRRLRSACLAKKRFPGRIARNKT